ncbi:hypothetical protein [Lactobacillus paragasseri]|uniref:hypothetical protein n=1 Tax=Lactobacillus paragasseri TaxID=2107999 RepID=UPI0021CB13D5|nr:hypothetical protein [Lactobacillus paragasseri]
MVKELKYDQIYINPNDTFLSSRIDYLQSKIEDKNTNLAALSSQTGLSESLLRHFRLDSKKITKSRVQTLEKLDVALMPFIENNSLLKKLGLTDQEIENRSLRSNKFKELIIKKANLKFTDSDTNENIALLLLNSLFSIFEDDEYLMNLVLKNTIKNMHDLDVLRKSTINS